MALRLLYHTSSRPNYISGSIGVNVWNYTDNVWDRDASELKIGVDVSVVVRVRERSVLELSIQKNWVSDSEPQITSAESRIQIPRV